METEMETKKQKKTLFVFDFDWTLLDDNTDTFIMSLCPQLELKRNLATLRKQHDGWTKLMDHVFSLLHREGCSRDDIERHIRKLTLHDEAMKSVRFVHDSAIADSIIISDSNTVFIQLILEECNIAHMFQAVFTNPAHFEADGKLTVSGLVAHDCSVCKGNPNICKSKVLKEYTASHGGYDRIVYVGDGRGDFCPASNLSKDDVVICREGYPLAGLLSSDPCQASVYVTDFAKSMSEIVAQSMALV